MKKRLCMLCMLTVFSVGFLSAKVKMNLELGPVYTYFSSRTTVGNRHTSWTAHTGGLNVLFGAEFVKNFGVYGSANLAFGKNYWTKSSQPDSYSGQRHTPNFTYAIDSQLGLFYVFHPTDNLDLRLGLGLGIGGSGHNTTIAGTKTKVSQLNIGGGVDLTLSYMFTKLIGIYGGVSDTIYAPVYQATTTITGSTNNKSSSTNVSGKLANSFSCKAGIRFNF